MKVFVVYQDIGCDDGFGAPLAAFSTKEQAESHIARVKSTLGYCAFFEIKELTLDHPAD